MEKHFETYADYLAFLDILEKQLSEITFNAKRKLNCKITGTPAVTIDRKEAYFFRLTRASQATLD